MLLQKEREEIVAYGRKMISSGLTKGTGGNISIFNREQGLVAISPSGLDYYETTPVDVVILNLDGEVVEGERKPSSELDMHLIYYRNREDINALVHTHSPYAKTIASLGWELPAVSYLITFAGPNVRCAPYETFGTKQLAEAAFEGMINRRAVLLANHGLIAGANNIKMAFTVAEEIEFCAQIYYQTKSVGEPKLLPEDEMENLAKKFEGYGQQ
ncbi:MULTISPECIES: L-fuculose-phosphate aldolase [Bacillus cereus group]|uniref:L-fuculose-phosphate aldolase n=1 Tax=Bacillus cereus group TaxID=86661 RepID=UPI000BEC9A0B|nr:MULTISPECIES: L-fuculose-phosphate aldolase [Bacillus cereus group]MBJ7931517.1 L-fuculose-phosphate aldolase [Bacillus cereus group sp. N31]PEG15336.1 fuculose phosphate aldolase [Bacillus toyonensis]PEK06443.1 fuculose phosphate aldolase [Bacillus toyonensis]PGA56775.1 fuculose phosphate aldolase [Bacillus toyonensis]PGC00177.1 fuculose phosphate aldolase [Bacillus toyonensis]